MVNNINKKMILYNYFTAL